MGTVISLIWQGVLDLTFVGERSTFLYIWAVFCKTHIFKSPTSLPCGSVWNILLSQSQIANKSIHSNASSMIWNRKSRSPFYCLPWANIGSPQRAVIYWHPLSLQPACGRLSTVGLWSTVGLAPPQRTAPRCRRGGFQPTFLFCRPLNPQRWDFFWGGFCLSCVRFSQWNPSDIPSELVESKALGPACTDQLKLAGCV